MYALVTVPHPVPTCKEADLELHRYVYTHASAQTLVGKAPTQGRLISGIAWCNGNLKSQRLREYIAISTKQQQEEAFL